MDQSESMVPPNEELRDEASLVDQIILRGGDLNSENDDTDHEIDDDVP
jgi:hypothetical protein